MESQCAGLVAFASCDFANAAVRLFKTRSHFAPPLFVLNCVLFIPQWGSKIAVLRPLARQSRCQVLLRAHPRWPLQQQVQALNKPRVTVYIPTDDKKASYEEGIATMCLSIENL